MKPLTPQQLIKARKAFEILREIFGEDVGQPKSARLSKKDKKKEFEKAATETVKNMKLT